jgi:hypothetical protein
LTLQALAQSGTCPSSGSVKNSSIVAATFTPSGSTTTYTFISLIDESPIVGGVPGLVKYCVYTTPQPNKVNAVATGADGSLWASGKDSKDFFFGRPGGEKTNIPLDGKTTTIGNATWTGSAPTSQTILLHISDATECANLYGSGTSNTCFVKPSSLVSACNIGDGPSNAAYNAIPFGGVNCSPPSLAFEGDGVAEFGDEVTLVGTARQLVSLKVLFTSYGCSVSGHWYSGTA